jgi:hypothetical protein
MKRVERNIILISGAFAVLLMVLQTTGCGMCKNTLIAEASSPNGQLKAVTFVLGCGAVTGSDTRVLILPSNQQLSNTTDHVFCIDDDIGKIRGLIGVDRAIPLKLHWQSDQVLVISYPRRARVIDQHQKMHGVSIKFEPVD